MKLDNLKQLVKEELNRTLSENVRNNNGTNILERFWDRVVRNNFTDDDDIIEAIKILKHFPAKYNTYTGWYYNYNKGVLNRVTGEIFIDLRWLPNEKFAKEVCPAK